MPDYKVSDLTRFVAARLRGLMAQHSVKQSELAESIGVSQSHLSKMVRGMRPIDLDQLDGMCLALGADTADLLKEAEAALESYDFTPNARFIFVDDGIRLASPMDTEGWGGDPIVPPHSATRARGRSVGEAHD